MTALEDAIETLTLGKVTVGSSATDKITSSQLTLLESYVADKVTRMDPGFTATELVVFKARLILDMYVNSSGSGQLTEKTVKDTRWKIAPNKSSSSWMDQALQQIADFRANKSFNFVPTGIARSDAEITAFDGTTILQYGDPSNDL